MPDQRTASSGEAGVREGAESGHQPTCCDSINFVPENCWEASQTPNQRAGSCY